jgi:hypothetical protein
VLPGRLDRWLISGLRRLGLDKTERNTYHNEAAQLRNWLQSGAQDNGFVFGEDALSKQ